MMNNNQPVALETYKNEVAIKFQLYNGLFTALPFHKIERTGNMLALLLMVCEDGYANKLSPEEIINVFFARQTQAKLPTDQMGMLFRFIQYAERQVVLLDALEDAAFAKVNDLAGRGSLKQSLDQAYNLHKEEAVEKKLNDFCVQLVLTAHPTQFYPGSVLGIINDLSKAVKQNNALQINSYLQQLGKTAFLNKEKPTPLDEAISLLWFLENIFYTAGGIISSKLKSRLPGLDLQNNPVIKMGFWPGGDRDGNPFVKAETTLKVAHALHGSILKCYYTDVRKMRRRLTFNGVEPLVIELEKKLYNYLFLAKTKNVLSAGIILDYLEKMKAVLTADHNSLFIDLVENLINKVQVFGVHFATIDIRQDAGKHTQLLTALAEKENLLAKNYASLLTEKKLLQLQKIKGAADVALYEETDKDILESMQIMKTIQNQNGEAGCNRYIISHSTDETSVMEVYSLLLLSGWKAEELTVDIVPLFETVVDLQQAAKVMEALYKNKIYKKHLQLRGNKQTIMLGFSDGTKDGGYLMANWSIYKAKDALSKVAAKHKISVVFFDGRGGPPARGGGKTHQFYASMGNNISNKEIQITVQGQTISSSFGTVESAQYNMEQLLSAGLVNEISGNQKNTWQRAEEKLLAKLAERSLAKYLALKNHPLFLKYLQEISPLLYYSETNIASRPTKRGKGEMQLDDLRAIPFVGAWSQMKQNITGFYGVGTALEGAKKAGNWTALKSLYKSSLFFKTLIDNCEMSMRKCFFPLTQHLAKDETYAEFYKLIQEEFTLSEHYIKLLTGHKTLMEDYPVDEMSIHMRDRIVLPLITIQQYAIAQLRKKSGDEEADELFKKLIIRSSFGIINAARNSV